jgi:hypothetical protein
MAKVADELSILDVADVDGADPPHRRAGGIFEWPGEWWGWLLDRLELCAKKSPVFGTEPGTHVPDVAEVAVVVVCAEHHCPESPVGAWIPAAHDH